jgi:hypothetical protein
LIAVADPPERTESDLTSVVGWYNFMVEKLGATAEEARGLMEKVISAIELNPPRAAEFPELFVYLDAQWRHFGQKRKLLDKWLTKMARKPVYWPPRPSPRGSRVGEQILKALRTGSKKDFEIVRAFPKSAKMTLAKLSPTLGLAMKAGKVMRVGWGEYALRESGLTPYIPPNRLIVEFVIGAPDYPPAEDALVAAMRARGHTDDGIYHSLRWLRESGVLAPRRDGRVPLSAESMAKRERGEVLRDGRDAVLWAPPLVVPAEVATWESRLINASHGDRPYPGHAEAVRPDRPQVHPAKRAAEQRTMKNSAQESCIQAYMKLIEANPDGAPKARAVLEKQMMEDFKVTRDEARYCRAKAIQRHNSRHPNNPCKWVEAGVRAKESGEEHIAKSKA